MRLKMGHSGSLLTAPTHLSTLPPAVDLFLPLSAIVSYGLPI